MPQKKIFYSFDFCVTLVSFTNFPQVIKQFFLSTSYRPDTKEIPEYLHALAKYNFADETVALCMFVDDFEWSLVSISGVYDFNKTRIYEKDFVEITGNDFVYNIAPTGKNVKAKTFKLNISKIDRHVLMKQFTINVGYIFLEDVQFQLHSTQYTFDASWK